MIVPQTQRENDYLCSFSNDAATHNLQKFPVNLNPFILEQRTCVLRDRIKSVRGESENRRPCARQANAQKTWMRGGSNERSYFRQARDLITGVSVRARNLWQGPYQSFPIRLVYPILHCFVYKLGIWWRLTEGGRKHGQSLQIEHLVYAWVWDRS